MSNRVSVCSTQSPVLGLRVLVFMQRLWGIRIGHHIASRLYSKGARLSAIVEKKPTLEFVNDQTEVSYEYILSYEEIMNDPIRFVEHEVSLDSICDDLGLDSIWPLATTENNLVRSYTGRYYYDNIQNKDDDYIASYVKAFYCQTRRLFDSFRPDVVISPNFVAPNHLIVEQMAKRHGIRMMAVTHTRVRGIYSFKYDHKHKDGPFVRRVKDLQNRKVNSTNVERALNYIETSRERHIPPLYQERMKATSQYDPFLEAKRALGGAILYLIKGGVNPMPNIGPTPDNRPLRYILRDLFAEWKNRIEIGALEYTPMDNLGRFAYFPLQVQPEAEIDTVATHFNNQFETVRLAAMSLPGDMTLAVKEHPGMVGKRGRLVYRRLAGTPNVKLVDHRVAPVELIRRCDLVIAAVGTSIVEAAFYRKPAIQFSDLGVTQLLPNVVRHTDFTTLSDRIREVLSSNPDPKAYEFHLTCFVAGAMDVGFAVDHDGLWVYGYKVDLDELYLQFEEEMLKCCEEVGRLHV